MERPKSPSLTLLSSPRKTDDVRRYNEAEGTRLQLTILRLEIPVQDHRLPRITGGFRIRTQSHDIASSCRRVLTEVTPVQRADDLAEDAPYELLLAHLVLVLEVTNDAPEVAIAAVFHIQVQVLRCLDVVALEVGYDVWVAEFLEN